MNPTTLWLLINSLATWYLVGLIWTIQVVHYPLFRLVGGETYAEYQQQHQTRISFIVGLPMLLEAASSVMLLRYPPAGVSTPPILVGLACVLVIWASTAFIQVPCHARLEKNWDAQAHRRLVLSNWIRTLAWSIRGGLTAWMLAMSSSPF